MRPNFTAVVDVLEDITAESVIQQLDVFYWSGGTYHG